MREQIVYQEIDPCPYLEGNDSKTPLRLQFEQLSGAQTDSSFARGDRRVGRMLYDVQCPSCEECEPVRVDVNMFKPSKSQRRILRKNEDLRVEMVSSSPSEEKADLYNKHKSVRGLNKEERSLTLDGYGSWFSRSCMNTRELHYYYKEKLIGVSILDFGEEDISSVYFFFDPEFSDRSLGTFSALFELLWMKEQGLRYYYLGLYVKDCSHLNYKSRFYPHQRRIKGGWNEFEKHKAPRTEGRVE